MQCTEREIRTSLQRNQDLELDARRTGHAGHADKKSYDLVAVLLEWFGVVC